MATQSMIETQVIELNTSKVKRGWRARKVLGDIDELAASIANVGQLHPILVKPSKKEKGAYIIISGMRRLRACKKLKRKVRAIVCRPSDEMTALTMQLEENVKRLNFDKLEVGEGLLKLKERYEKANPETVHGWAIKKRGKKAKTKKEVAGKKAVARFTKEAARTLGISEREVYNLLNIGELPEKKKDEISSKSTAKERNKAALSALKEQRGERKLDKLEEKAKKKQKKEPKPSSKGHPIHLVHGSWQKVVPRIDDASIDLVCTDPQYGLKRSLISHAERADIGVDVPWDKLDLGWVAAVVPKLVKGGALVVFCPFELIGDYKWACKQLGLEYRGCLVWHKTNPPPAHRKVYMQSLEAMVWATKPGKPYYFKEWKNAGSRAAHNCIDNPVCGGDERLSHETQKPEELIRKLLKRHAPKGGVVLDPFTGTGTVAVCCKRRKLTCFAIEKEAKFIKMAKARLKAL